MADGLIRVDEVRRRVEGGETCGEIAHDMRRRTGESISAETVRRIAMEVCGVRLKREPRVKRHLVDVAELRRRVERGDPCAVIARDLSALAGVALSAQTVRAAAKKHGISLRRGPSSLRSRIPVDEVLARVDRGETCREIARELSARLGVVVAPQAVRAVARENGRTPPPAPGGRRAGPIADLAGLARRYHRGVSLTALAAEAGVHPVTLRKHLRRAGLYVPPGQRESASLPRAKRHLVDAGEVLRRLRRREPCAAIARAVSEQMQVPVSPELIRIVARENGWVFTPRSAGRPLRKVSNLAELSQRHHAGQSLRSLAAEAGVSGATLRRRLEEAGLVDRKGAAGGAAW